MFSDCMICSANFVISFLPGILWMWYIYRSDKFEPEPVGRVISVFFGGFLVVIPVIFVELGVSSILGLSGDVDSLYEAVGASWFVAGLVEEFAKFGIVLFAVYYTKEFDEPVDGIVYSSAAALGFATLENFFYMMKHGTAVILIRGPLSTFGHLLFSAMWGYGLGRGKFHPKTAKRLATTGLLLAAGSHGLFNFLLMSEGVFGKTVGMVLSFCVLPFTAVLWLILKREIHRAEDESPFNKNKKKKLNENDEE